MISILNNIIIYNMLYIIGNNNVKIYLYIYICLPVAMVVTMDSACIPVTKVMLRIFTVCLHVARVIPVVP